MTRRQAVALGAAAGVGAAAAGPGGLLSAAVAGASAGTAGGASYLQRSTYVGRIGQQFAVGNMTVELTAVTDVLGAVENPRLRGHEDAFALEFAGRADALPGDTYELFHTQLGPFPLFVSPVGAVSGLVQTYGVTVDRTVRLKHVPGPPAPAAATAPREPEGQAAETPAAPPSPRDEAIVVAREVAAATPAQQRRRAARRSDAQLRRTRAKRVRFKRKKRLERKRLARARGGWLTRHGR